MADDDDVMDNNDGEDIVVLQVDMRPPSNFPPTNKADWTLDDDRVTVHKNLSFLGAISGQAMVRIGDSMVFLGGAWLQQDIDMHCDMSRVYVRPVQHLEPEQTTWLSIKVSGDVPLMTTGAALLVVEDKLILFGGYISHKDGRKHGWTHRLYYLDMKTWKWTRQHRAGSWPTSRDKMGCFVRDGKCYFFGGYGLGPSSSTTRFDSPCVDDDVFQVDADEPERCWNNQILCWDGKAWSSIPTFGTRPSARAAVAFCQDGKDFFIFGGRHGPHRLNDLFHYDIDARTWTSIEYAAESELPVGRSWSSLDMVRDHKGEPSRLYMWGGLLQHVNTDASDRRLEMVSSEVWHLDLVDKDWTRLREKGPQRYWHQSTIIDGVLTVAGGVPFAFQHNRRCPSSQFGFEEMQVEPRSLLSTAMRAVISQGKMPKRIKKVNELPSNLRRAILWHFALNGSKAQQKWARRQVKTRDVFLLNTPN